MNLMSFKITQVCIHPKVNDSFCFILLICSSWSHSQIFSERMWNLVMQMGFRRCCLAWDSWGFVKKDEDRAPVIQSCVYTEIHVILTLTSLWLKAACFELCENLFKSMLFPGVLWFSNSFCQDVIPAYLIIFPKCFLVFWFHRVWHGVLMGDDYFLTSSELCTLQFVCLFVFTFTIKNCFHAIYFVCSTWQVQNPTWPLIQSLLFTGFH